MSKTPEKNSHSRLIIAGTLFVASIVASLLIAYFSTMGGKYWVLTKPLSRGVQIASTDIALVKITLGRGVSGYLSSAENPIGSITRRNLKVGELLNYGDLTSNVDELDTESLSLAIQASDIPQGISTGDLISLYQIFDGRNGEVIPPPQRIISGIFIKEISRKSANFSSDVTLTITLRRDDVPTVLAATSQGRIAVVASRG